MNPPEFIRFRCANTENIPCATCPRDFVIPIHAIEGIFRTIDDKAEIVLKASNFRVDPRCIGPGGQWNLRYIKTSLSWDAVIDLIDGNIKDGSSVNMVVV